MSGVEVVGHLGVGEQVGRGHQPRSPVARQAQLRRKLPGRGSLGAGRLVLAARGCGQPAPRLDQKAGRLEGARGARTAKVACDEGHRAGGGEDRRCAQHRDKLVHHAALAFVQRGRERSRGCEVANEVLRVCAALGLDREARCVRRLPKRLRLVVKAADHVQRITRLQLARSKQAVNLQPPARVAQKVVGRVAAEGRVRAAKVKDRRLRRLTGAVVALERTLHGPRADCLHPQ
mmetsp:Transcript_50777/g.164513  ORF Transcript_50777/g.164513 Transcript_50777/m.164513 type:complete len:233 (-) Transcript_50777:28-726(-)